MGMGSAADFVGKDLDGQSRVRLHDARRRTTRTRCKRADEKGAAAIFEVDMLPGNMRYQALSVEHQGAGVHGWKR